MLVVFSMVWLVTMWRWQSRGADVGGTDIVTHLLVLPVVLLLALWAAQKVALQLRSGQVGLTPSASSSGAASAQPGATEPGADEALRRFSVALIDARVSLFAGESPRDIAMQVRERLVWPTLDEHLQDLEGNPVFSARVADLECPADEESDASDSTWRAHALLWRVWRPLQARLSEVLDNDAVGAWLGRHSQAGAVAAGVDEQPAHLAGLAASKSVGTTAQARLFMTVALACPTHWSPEQRTRLMAQLQATMPEGLAQPRSGVAWHWLSWEASEPEALWPLIDGVLQSWARSGEAASLLVLTADSALDDESVAQRQARGELFTAAHQQGRIPGEGAVGLWLASPAWPGLDALDPPVARMQRPLMVRRDKSADALGRVGSTVLQQGLRAALEWPCVPAGRVVSPMCLVSDGDHRASRTGELYESLTEVIPTLDPTLSVWRLGDTCGDIGLPGALAPVALAAGLLIESPEPDGAEPGWPVAIAACVQSPWQRVVVTLSPWLVALPETV
jgi:hypothetical protein